MIAECTTQPPTFHNHGRREVTARFDGGAIASDGGGLLLRERELTTGIIGRFAECFKDTELEQARCETIRLKVLKIGAPVRVTFRKIWLRLASGYPYQAPLARACENLRRAFPMPLRVEAVQKAPIF